MPKRIYANLRDYFQQHPDGEAMKVAKDVGCSYPYLSQIKWNERQPTLPIALKISRRCHVPIESLVLDRRTLDKELADLEKAS